MRYKGYQETLQQVRYETQHGSDETRHRAAKEHLPEVGEIVKQVGEDRIALIGQWEQLRTAWQEMLRPAEEPHRDESKAAKAWGWRAGAAFMFLIETAFAGWLATTYLALAVLPESGLPRVAFLAVVGFLLTGAASLLFHKLMTPIDDDKRPEPSYRKLARWAALSSAVGLLAVASFLLTRQYSVGGPILQLALAVLTIALAAGVAASLHCAETLHRVNRVAALYDESDKLLGNAKILLIKIEGLLGAAPPMAMGVPVALAKSHDNE